MVVSGDAVAAKNCSIYEKPRSNEEAAEFLRELSGSKFQFVTSLAVMNSKTGKMLDPNVYREVRGVELCRGI